VSTSTPQVTLGAVAELCLGKMLDAAKNKGRLLPYLRNPNVRWLEVDTTDIRMMPFEEREDDRYGLRAGDIVVCEGGEAGRAAIWDGRIPEMKFQKAIHRVRPMPQLDARYFVHRLKFDYDAGRLADYYTGATIKHLTGQDLARYRFPLPPLAEQLRVAEILDKADALRAKRRVALAQLDTLTQSIFLDMFGDPSTNPNAYPFTQFGDQIESVRYGTGSPPEYVTEGVPFIRATNVKRGTIVGKEMKRISPADAARLTKCKVTAGDLIIVRSGVNTGDSAIIPPAYDGSCAAFDLIVELNRPAAVFHNYFLNSDYGRRVIEPLARRAAQPHLNAEQLRALRFISPPYVELEAFATVMAQIDIIRTSQEASLVEYELLFASIQDGAFRGDL